MSSLVQKYIEVCIFQFANDRASYLLLHRSKDDEMYPNLWQFVTGSLHSNETAVNGAIRELREETGLEPHAIWVVPYVNMFYDEQRDAVNLNPLFAVQIKPGTSPVLSHEHQQFEWLTYEDARSRLVWPGQQEGLRIVHEFIVAGKDAAKQGRIR